MDIEIYGRVQTPPIDYTGIPQAYWPSRTIVVKPDGSKYGGPIKDKVSAVCRSMADCDDLVAWFGNQPNFCPDLPILLMIPGAITVVSGLGYSTAAELRDCCCEVWGVKTGGDAAKRFDVNEMRERAGLPRREDVPAMVQQAFRDRVAKHKASPVTDPWRQHQYPNPTNKTLHKVADSQDWKRN